MNKTVRIAKTIGEYSLYLLFALIMVVVLEGGCGLLLGAVEQAGN